MRHFRVYYTERVQYLDPWGVKVSTSVHKVLSTKTLRETVTLYTFHNGYSDVHTPICVDWYGQRYANKNGGVDYHSTAWYQNIDDPSDRTVWLSSIPAGSLDAHNCPINRLGERVSDIPVRIAE